MTKKSKLRTLLISYLRWTIYLSVLLVLMDVYLFFIDTTSGIVGTVFTVIYIIAVAIIYIVRRSKVNEGLVNFASDYGQAQRKLLNELELPYAILDNDGKLLWMNILFSEIAGDTLKYHHNINNVFAEITTEVFPSDAEPAELSLVFNKHFYRAVLHRVYISSFDDDTTWNSDMTPEEMDNSSIIVCYLYDETEITTLRKENSDQKLVVGLVYVDNYEDTLESADDIRRSLLPALLDKKINHYFKGVDAIIRKLEKDRYLVIFHNKYLEELTSGKFTILDTIREINVGSGSPATLSIGIGINADSPEDGFNSARLAMDMAQKRGGDQVVIRNDGNYEYFGGKSGSVEKSTRVRARMTAQTLKEIMNTAEKVLIMGHSMADIDCFGSGIGVYRIAKSMNKEAHIVLGEITTSMKNMVTRFLENADYQGVIIDANEALNIVDEETLLVVVDVNRPSYTECPKLIDRAGTVAVIDHHRQTGESFKKTALSYIEPYASSACELVAEILQYSNDNLKLRGMEADAMYAGIVIDTNNFTMKAGIRTFEAAAYLRKSGADITKIRKSFRTDMPEYLAKAKAVSEAELFKSCYAFTVLEAGNLVSPTVVGAQVANELLDITNMKASFVFTEYNDKIYISARSIDELNVQVVMEKLGGGGHMSIAGAQLTDCTLSEAMDRVKAVLEEMNKTEGGNK